MGLQKSIGLVPLKGSRNIPKTTLHLKSGHPKVFNKKHGESFEYFVVYHNFLKVQIKKKIYKVLNLMRNFTKKHGHIESLTIH